MTQRDRSLLLKNGLTVDVIDDSSARFVYFSKPVRGIELDRQESETLGKFLFANEDKATPMQVLRSLIDNGFFDEPKNLQTIRQSVRAQGLFLKSSLLNTLLAKMVRRREIARDGRKRLYTYKIAHEQRT